jgi:hypothetical protein
MFVSDKDKPSDMMVDNKEYQTYLYILYKYVYMVVLNIISQPKVDSSQNSIYRNPSSSACSL